MKGKSQQMRALVGRERDRFTNRHIDRAGAAKGVVVAQEKRRASESPVRSDRVSWHKDLVVLPLEPLELGRTSCGRRGSPISGPSRSAPPCSAPPLARPFRSGAPETLSRSPHPRASPARLLRPGYSTPPRSTSSDSSGLVPRRESPFGPLTRHVVSFRPGRLRPSKGIRRPPLYPDRPHPPRGSVPSAPTVSIRHGVPSAPNGSVPIRESGVRPSVPSGSAPPRESGVIPSAQPAPPLFGNPASAPPPRPASIRLGAPPPPPRPGRVPLSELPVRSFVLAAPPRPGRLRDLDPRPAWVAWSPGGPTTASTSTGLLESRESRASKPPQTRYPLGLSGLRRPDLVLLHLQRQRRRGSGVSAVGQSNVQRPGDILYNKRRQSCPDRRAGAASDRSSNARGPSGRGPSRLLPRLKPKRRASDETGPRSVPAANLRSPAPL